MNPPVVTRHLVVRGLVQGVGYRWSMVQAARQLGVHGWVRNRRDGSVEALAAGEAGAVEALIRWAHEGPAGAQVDTVDAVAAADGMRDGWTDGFAQRETI